LFNKRGAERPFHEGKSGDIPMVAEFQKPKSPPYTHIENGTMRSAFGFIHADNLNCSITTLQCIDRLKSVGWCAAKPIWMKVMVMVARTETTSFPNEKAII
jgi:hypothetical protein